MHGMDTSSGKLLSGIAHLRQSITDILTTPIGSRVMRPNYGSRLYELMDAPINQGTIIDVYAFTIDALVRWEPRIRVSRVRLTKALPGTLELTVEGEETASGEPISLEGIQV